MSNEAELSLIGMALTSRGVFDEATAAGVTDASFMNDRAALTWRALVAVDKAGLTPDLVTVAAQVRSLPPGGVHPEAVADMPIWLVARLDDAPIAVNARYFIDATLNGAWLRRAGAVTSQLQKHILAALAAPGDIADTRRNLAELVDAITTAPGARTDEPEAIQEVVHRLAGVIDQRVIDRREGRPRGVTTGLRTLDVLLGGGMRPGGMYTVAARTGIGKTTFAINAATAAARAGRRVGFWSTEQLNDELAQKLLSRVSRVVGMSIDTGNLQESAFDDLQAGLREMHGWTFSMDDRFGSSFDKLVARARRSHRRQPFGLIVVDYIQQMVRDGERFDTRQAAVASISRGLKQLAIDLEVPVLVLAQINREGAKAGAEAEAHHIKDSGSIEQDSDVIVIINAEGDQTFLDVKKNRHGPTKRLLVKRELAINLFNDDNIALPEVPS